MTDVLRAFIAHRLSAVIAIAVIAIGGGIAAAGASIPTEGLTLGSLAVAFTCLATLK